MAEKQPVTEVDALTKINAPYIAGDRPPEIDVVGEPRNIIEYAAGTLNQLLGLFNLRRTMDTVRKSPEDFDYSKYLGRISGKMWEFYGQQTKMEYDRKCFTADTRISLVNGQEIPIGEMAQRSSQGEKFWVYAVDKLGNRILPVEVSKIRKTGTVSQLAEVMLDNGEIVRCTVDHPFMLRNGAYEEAQYLKPGTSLMPLYRKLSEEGQLNGYRLIYDVYQNRYRFEHRYFFVGNIQRGQSIIHHEDWNKLNNIPTNLQGVSKKSHGEIHARHMVEYNHRRKGKSNVEVFGIERAAAIEQRKSQSVNRAFASSKDKLKSGIVYKYSRENEFNRRRYLKRLIYILSRISRVMKWFAPNSATQVRDVFPITLKEYRSIMGRASIEKVNEKQSGVLLNHKVIKVNIIEEIADVYDIEVPIYHNFAISAGVFVHNTRYRDYSQMAVHPIIAGALQLYTDDATQVSPQTGKTIWVESADSKYADTLNRMFSEVGMEDRIWDWVFTLAMYGDFIPHLITAEGKGIMAVEDDLHPGDIDRVELNGKLIGFMCRVIDDRIMKPWDFVHFRHMTTWRRDWRVIEYNQMNKAYQKGNKMRITTHYGNSIIEPPRSVFKQLKLLEDTLILARLSKSVLQRVYIVNGGNSTPQVVMRMVEAIKRELKSREAIDYTNKTYDSQYNPIGVNEDIVVPTLGEKGSIDVKEIGGNVDIKAIVDVDYMRKQLFGALMIPPAFLGYADDLPGSLGESALVRLEIRYARSVKRLQRALRVGLKRMCQIHLALNDMYPDPEAFEVMMESISSAEDEERKSVLEKSADVVQKLVGVLKDMGYDPINREYILSYLIDAGLLPLYNISVEDIAGAIAEDLGSAGKDKAAPPDINPADILGPEAPAEGAPEGTETGAEPGAPGESVKQKRKRRFTRGFKKDPLIESADFNAWLPVKSCDAMKQVLADRRKFFEDIDKAMAR